MTTDKHFIDQLADDFLEEQRERPLPNRFMALARSATSVADDPAAVEQTNIVAHVDSLERDGCEYIDGLYFYMARAECPAAARELVAIINGISGGQFDAEIEISDPELAQRAGVSESTIGYRRRVYKQWARESTLSPIGITEGDFNTVTGKNETTRYRVSVVPIVAELVRRARSKVLYERSRKGALRESAQEVHTRMMAEAADEMIGETPLTPLKSRKSKKDRKAEDIIKSNKKAIRTFYEKTGFMIVKKGDAQMDAGQLLAAFMQDVSEMAEECNNDILNSHSMGYGWSEFDRERKKRRKQSKGS